MRFTSVSLDWGARYVRSPVSTVVSARRDGWGSVASSPRIVVRRRWRDSPTSDFPRSPTWQVHLPLDVGVVVVAAGRGLRLGGVPKQFRDLSGVPVLRSALEPFLSHPNVIFTVAVLPPDIATSPPDWLAEITGIRLGVVAGGLERTDSVRAGLAALPEAAQVVLVHDGARPFPSREVIDQVIEVARSGRA